MVLMPYIHSHCQPKDIHINSGPVLIICKKIDKIDTIFDMKLNENNVKYLFLNSG